LSGHAAKRKAAEAIVGRAITIPQSTTGAYFVGGVIIDRHTDSHFVGEFHAMGIITADYTWGQIPPDVREELRRRLPPRIRVNDQTKVRSINLGTLRALYDVGW
jgi:hypothetical protein